MEPTGWVEVAANLQLLVAGAMVYLAGLNLVLWRSFRVRNLLWLTFWAVAIAAVLLANFALFAVTADGWAGTWLFVRTVTISVAALLALPFASSLGERHVPRALFAALAGLLTLRAVLWLTTDVVYAHRLDDGVLQYGSLLALLTVPPVLLWFGYLVWAVGLATNRNRVERALVLLGAFGTGALLLASIAIETGAVSELLTGYTTVPVALGLQLVVLGRLAERTRHFQQQADYRAGMAEMGARALLPIEPDELLGDAVEVVRRLLGADRCDAYLGASGHRVARAATAVAGEHGRPLPAARTEAPIGLPEEQLGWLVAERRHPFGDEDDRFLEGVAFVVAASLRRRRAEDEIRHRAMHDDLTGLPNRVLLQDRLQTALERAARTGCTVAVIFCDLDRFKYVNDVHGHRYGDEVLVATAARLQSAVRAGDTVCRFGGDEFVVVCEDLSESDAYEIAERMQHTLAEPLTIDSVTVEVPASIGIATSVTPHGPEALLRDADTAMYRAKDQGGARIEVFEEALRVQLLERLETERLLAEATRRHEIVLHYQPIVDLETSSPVRVEALARWRRDRDRLVLPDDWIPLVEHTGQILEVGRMVLTDACAEVGSWAERSTLGVCVNVSPIQLSDDVFLDDVENALAGRITPGRLCLEITEQAMMRNGRGAIRRLHRIRELGVHLALDDFGSGYSSLSLLGDLPLDSVKIDRTFIQQLSNPHVRLLVAGILAMAQSLGLDVVAEGVERDEQARILRDLGCAHAQGFLLGRPQPPAEARAALG